MGIAMIKPSGLARNIVVAPRVTLMELCTQTGRGICCGLPGSLSSSGHTLLLLQVVTILFLRWIWISAKNWSGLARRAEPCPPLMRAMRVLCPRLVVSLPWLGGLFPFGYSTRQTADERCRLRRRWGALVILERSLRGGADIEPQGQPWVFVAEGGGWRLAGLGRPARARWGPYGDHTLRTPAHGPEHLTIP